MNGCLIKNTPIAVDFWNRNKISNTSLFFLSHLHEDHIKGLTPSWREKIYTSPINKTLLIEIFGKNFSENVTAIQLNDPFIIPLTKISNETITVTLIDANHVPGSVMFLFEGYFGTILYTGDMRHGASIVEHSAISGMLDSGGIDLLYLDNTFCHPNFKFPSRQDVTRNIIHLIKKYPNHVVKLGIRSLGKEMLLEAVARALDERILVTSARFKILQLLERPSFYTTIETESRIHAVMINTIHRQNHQQWNKIKPTLSIRLSAINYNSDKNYPSSDYCYVPYSDHSSYTELVEFVKALKPREIIPIVHHNKNKTDSVSLSLTGRDDMSIFQPYLSETNANCPINIPPCVLALSANCQTKSHSTKNRCYSRSFRRTSHAKKGVYFSSMDNDDSDLPNIPSTQEKSSLLSPLKTECFENLSSNNNKYQSTNQCCSQQPENVDTIVEQQYQVEKKNDQHSSSIFEVYSSDPKTSTFNSSMEITLMHSSKTQKHEFACYKPLKVKDVKSCKKMLGIRPYTGIPFINTKIMLDLMMKKTNTLDIYQNSALKSNTNPYDKTVRAQEQKVQSSDKTSEAQLESTEELMLCDQLLDSIAQCTCELDHRPTTDNDTETHVVDQTGLSMNNGQAQRNVLVENKTSVQVDHIMSRKSTFSRCNNVTCDSAEVTTNVFNESASTKMPNFDCTNMSSKEAFSKALDATKKANHLVNSTNEMPIKDCYEACSLIEKYLNTL